MKYKIKASYLFESGKIIAISLLILISIITGVLASVDRRRLGEICLKDFLITYNFMIVPYVLLPILFLAVVIHLNGMYDDKRLIRYSDIRRFYFDIEIKGILVSALYIVITAVMLLTGGLIVSECRIDNWTFPNSVAQNVYRDYLVNSSFIKIFCAVFLTLFLLLLINMNILIIIHRYTGHWIIGFFLCVVGNLYFLTQTHNNDFFVTYNVYQNGWRYGCLLGPFIVYAVTFIIIMFMGKADSLRRGK